LLLTGYKTLQPSSILAANGPHAYRTCELSSSGPITRKADFQSSASRLSLTNYPAQVELSLELLSYIYTEQVHGD